jgi:hypothetical protein
MPGKRFWGCFAAGLSGLLAGAALMLLLAPGRSETGMPAGYPLDLAPAGMHSHRQKEVPAGEVPPTLSLEVLADPMKERTYSLHLRTEHFRFTPEAVSRAPVFGEGHAHLYVDDVLLGRIYGSWHHLPRLKPGKHEILVTLNWNNHDEYAVGGSTIAARQALEVK